MSRKIVWRVALGALVLVLVLALVVTIVGLSFASRPVPQVDGERSLPGLTGRVTVMRDNHGVPQIYGDSITDIARAQGYVHAQDRFFEMDLRRHVTAGRLAELVGASGLETDKVIRTLGWRRVAEAELPTLAPETRRVLQAYAEGVNSYLDGRSLSEVSLEYPILGLTVPGYHIEDWTPTDSLAWLKAMAWDLRGDYDDELARARLQGRLPHAQIDQLYPPYDYAQRPPILSGRDWQPADDRGLARSAVPPAMRAEDTRDEVTSAKAVSVFAGVSRALEGLPELLGRGEGVGSNSWVVSGARSTTGYPLLANDPHLQTGIPGIWYQVGLHCRTVSSSCPLRVAGFSFAGVPGVVIGHNEVIAWGFTNLGPDVTDFYLEKTIVGNKYLRDRRWTDLLMRTETIKVAGGKDEKIVVRETVHGPILSDVLPSVADARDRAPALSPAETDTTYAVSLAWTGLEPSKTADAILGFDTATSFAAFRQAASLFAAPAQNLVYADRAGHIGYQAPGLIPVRQSALEDTPPGYLPAPGWDSTYDWTGYVPFAQLPSALDPPEGFIVAANQAVTASRRPFLTTEWDHGYRSSRISELLSAKPKVSVADMRTIQMDNHDGFAPTLVKALLAVPLKNDRFTQEAQDLLRRWDYTTPANDSENSAAAAYYNAVWANLLRLTFDDEVPGDLQASGGDRYMAAVAALLATPKSGWWDNKLTPNITEGKDEILRQALVEARLELTRKLGKDPQTWRWGRLHRLELTHQVLGGESVPGPVRAIFNRGPYDMPGGSAIVNANGWYADEGYQSVRGPSMRMVVDLVNLDNSTWVNQTGASGHPQSDHYDDQIDAWVEGEQFPWAFSSVAVERATDQTLTLVPKKS